MRYVVIPGIGGSGPEHWQTLWELGWEARARRIEPASWDAPELDDWCRALERAVADGGGDVVLVAHSLGCLAAAAWLGAAQPVRAGVRGVVLVAPPDVRSASFPTDAAGSFVGVVPSRLNVPALVVSSDDDPYCEPERAREFAEVWDAGHVGVGRAGHINVASGVGEWPFGRALLEAFCAGLRETGASDAEAGAAA